MLITIAGFSSRIIVYLINITSSASRLDFDIFPIYNKFMKTKDKRRGRPKKSSEAAKSATVLLRMEQREKQGFTDAADLAGVPLSVWIRERLRVVARYELEKAAQPVAFLDG